AGGDRVPALPPRAADPGGTDAPRRLRDAAPPRRNGGYGDGALYALVAPGRLGRRAGALGRRGGRGGGGTYDGRRCDREADGRRGAARGPAARASGAAGGRERRRGGERRRGSGGSRSRGPDAGRPWRVGAATDGRRGPGAATAGRGVGVRRDRTGA